MKLKKYLYYLISLICSVYISYLICRINTLSIKSIIFITFVVGGIFEYITYLYIKNIQRKKITQKVIFLILIVSLIISGIVIKLNWKFFTSKFQPTSITIYSDDEDIVISNVIKNVIIDNIVYNIQGNHLINSNVLETNLEDKIYNNTNNLVIEFSKCSDIKIIFNSNTDEIHIKDGNNIIENINTCEDGYEYKVQSNIVKNNSFMIQLIMSELVLTYITFFTILLIKCVKNEKRYFIIAIIIAILGMWFYYTKYYIGILFPDSPGYIIYNFNEMFHLKFQSRTPIYPVIIRIC